MKETECSMCIAQNNKVLVLFFKNDSKKRTWNIIVMSETLHYEIKDYKIIICLSIRINIRY